MIFYPAVMLNCGLTISKKRFNILSTDVTDEKILNELSMWLAYGVHNTILHWSPDVVVLGGSVITKPGGLTVERVESHLRQIMKIFPQLPPVKKASLGDSAGIHGALVLAQRATAS